MPKVPRYVYEYMIQGNYGYGWDDLVSEDNMSDARTQLACYRENERSARHRVVTRRTLNPDRKAS
jgi:hypothetical protein